MVPGCMPGRVPGLVSGGMPGRVLSFAPDVERMVSFPLAKGVNMSSLLYIFSTLQLQAKVYHFRGYPIPSLKFCGGGGRLLPIGQLPDAANAKALVRSYSAAASCLAASSRWCSLLLGIGAQPGSFFPMVLCGCPATMQRCHLHLCHGTPAILPQRFGQQHFPDGALPRRRLSQGAPPRRPGQQQASFGGEKYSGLASNLAQMGRIC